MASRGEYIKLRIGLFCVTCKRCWPRIPAAETWVRAPPTRTLRGVEEAQAQRRLHEERAVALAERLCPQPKWRWRRRRAGCAGGTKTTARSSSRAPAASLKHDRSRVANSAGAWKRLHPLVRTLGWHLFRHPSSHSHALQPIRVGSLHRARQRHLGVRRRRGDNQELGRQEHRGPLRRRLAPDRRSHPATFTSRACCSHSTHTNHLAPRSLCMNAPYSACMHPPQASTMALSSCRVTGSLAWSTWPLGSAPARLLRLLVAALGSCTPPGRGRPTERPATLPASMVSVRWPVSQPRTRRRLAQLQRPSGRLKAALPSGPETRALGAWVPKSGHCGRPSSLI